MKRLALLVASGVIIALTSMSASAEEFTCRGSVGAITVDNVRVPDGVTCTLRGTTVKGTITIESNATLRAQGVRVIGNVQAEDAARVAITASSRVGGSVQVVQSGVAKVSGSRINGDILYDDNEGAVKALKSTVGGNVQAFQNTGGVLIRGNDIDGNLQCKENAPRPNGGGNTVGGNKEDQCARL